MACASAIALRVDGRETSVPAGTTLAALVARLGFAPHAVGTAIGDEFVPRAAREARVLQPGDAVLLFQPIVGG